MTSRRSFLRVASAAVITVPWRADARHSGSVRRVGVLAPFPEAQTMGLDAHPLLSAYRQAMRDLGYVEGQNIVFEGRRGPEDRIAHLADDLVRAKVDVIVAPVIAAAKRRTSTIPIVMASAGDAVVNGLVSNLPRLGGNVTGISWHEPELILKRIQLIVDVVPSASLIGILWDSTIDLS